MCSPCVRSIHVAKKKVAKEEGDPGSVPAAPVPCATRCWRGLRNSGLRPSDSPRPFPASPCVARHLPRGPKSVAARLTCRNSGLLRSTKKSGRKSKFGVARSSDAELWSAPGIEGRFCLRLIGRDSQRSHCYFRFFFQVNHLALFAEHPSGEPL